MAYKRVNIQGVDLLVDETTGAVLVDPGYVSGGKGSVKAAAGDMADEAVIATAVKNADLVVAAAKQVSVTAVSQTLVQLYGAALPAGVIAIGLVPEDGTKKVRFNPAAAANATTGALLPLPGVARMPLAAAVVATVQFIRDIAETGNVAATLLLLAPRN